MDIINFPAKVAEGSIVQFLDLVPSTDYLIVGKYISPAQNGIRNGTQYREVLISIADLLAGAGGAQTLAQTLTFGRNADVSGQVNDFGGIVAFNINTRTFSGNWTAITQAPGDNSTKLATTAYVDAGLATQNELSEVLAFGRKVDALGTINTFTNTPAINVNLRQLYNATGSLKVDWQLGELHNAPAGTLSVGWNVRKLYTSTVNDIAVNWELRTLTHGVAGTTSMQWNASGIKMGVGHFINDFGDVKSLSPTDRMSYDSGGIASIDWGVRRGLDGAGAAAYEWTVFGIKLFAAKYITDTANFAAIDTNSRVLIQSDGVTPSVDWNIRFLYNNWSVNTGNLAFGTSTFPASMFAGATFKVVTAPTSDVATQFSFYASLNGLGVAVPTFRTDSGDIVRIYQEIPLTVADATALSSGGAVALQASDQTVLDNMRTRINELEARLIAFGLL